MALFKRIEIWILLLLVIAGLGWVLWPDGNSDGSSPADGETGFTIDQSELKRDFGNAVLRITVTYNNSSPESLTLVEPAARLFGSADTQIPAFFLAGRFPPTIKPKTQKRAELEYWLEKEHLQGPLTLDIKGTRVQVKSDQPFDLEGVPNQESVSLTGLNWTL